MSSARHRTLSEILFAGYEGLKRSVWGSDASFSETLMSRYHALVPEGRRAVEFNTSPAVEKRFGANGKKVGRYLSPAENALLPADLVPAWIESMPDPERGQMLKDVCRLLGSLYVPIPLGDANTDPAHLGRISREFADTVQALVPIVADNRVDEQDLPFIPEAIRQCDELVGAVLATKATLEAVQRRHGGRV